MANYVSAVFLLSLRRRFIPKLQFQIIFIERNYDSFLQVFECQ